MCKTESFFAFMSIILLLIWYVFNGVVAHPQVDNLRADDLYPRTNATRRLKGFEMAVYPSQVGDHYLGPKAGTFTQRYLINKDYFDPSKPLLFIYIGDVISRGIIGYEVTIPAQTLKAAMVALEHRYFGDSKPTPVVSAKKLKKLLTISQTLQDIRSFASYITRVLRSAAPMKIVLFGDSYTGSLASWARQLYPDLFIGAVASSSPFDIKVAYNDYNSVAAHDFSNPKLGGSDQCLAEVTQAHAAFAGNLDTPERRRMLEQKFHICSGVLDKRSNQLYATQGPTLLAFDIQGNNPSCSEDYCNIERICRRFATGQEAPLDKLAAVCNTNNPIPPQSCRNFDWNQELQELADPRYNSRDRLLTFIACNGLGLFSPCDESNRCPFMRSEDRLAHLLEQCDSGFGIPEEDVNQKVKKICRKYGGKGLHSTTNVISINGKADPWYPVSITEKQAGVDMLMIEGASHCYWSSHKNA
ncbi:Thymus-specific serine protease [Perkinsus chesapeaki]|uniref:Thymus-specific serine protease n=1 Tax=Perkinsus chesapeaki TaxID=330153 RepID=A0A7J6MBN0_PERCH|nr:Thymus-specific serine protease [Perkinsus chesapeaki]